LASLRKPFALDVGANIGILSLMQAKLGANVLAVEPIPSLAQLHRASTLLNRLNPITPSMPNLLT